MAKYFSTNYLKKTVFDQRLTQSSKKIFTFLKYFNIALLVLTVVALVNNFNMSSVTNEINTGLTNITQATDNVISKAVQHNTIKIQFLVPVKEKDISTFVSDVFDQLESMNENNASIDIERNKENSTVISVKISNVEDYNHLKTIMGKLDYDSNVVVTIN